MHARIVVGTILLATCMRYAKADGFPFTNGPFTTTQVCPQSNPTVGATTQCQTADGTTMAQSNVNANVGGGTFSGNALAKSQAGTLGVATSVTLNHYSAATNVFVPGEDSAPNLARAQANWADTLTARGLPSTYNLTLTYNLDGSFSTNNTYFDSILNVTTFLFGSDGSSTDQTTRFERSYYTNSSIPGSFTQTFTGLSCDSFQLDLSMLATTDIPVLTASQVPIYQNVYLTGTGSANFANTLRIGTLVFTDSNGNQLNNVSVNSADGYMYNIASSAATPEPSSLLLTLSASVALLLWKRKSLLMIVDGLLARPSL